MLRTKTVGDEEMKVTQCQEGHFIALAHGDNDRESVEVLYDLLERSLTETYDFPLHEKAFAKKLLGLLDEVDE